MYEINSCKLRNYTQYDSVSGLYNKDEFYKKALEIIKNNPDEKYAIVCINVDRFKLINDIYGTEEGDKLLKYIGGKIKERLNFSKETCGRLYADNFALCILRSEGYEDYIVNTAAQLTAEYPLDFKIYVSFGIYNVDIDSNDISVASMCDRANMAIKSIKGNYKQRYAYYMESHRTSLMEEQEIINDMYDALRENQFHVYFQPKYYLSNNKLIGAEALVRWFHPVKGNIPPNKFIPIFEKCGFITYMDEYVWECVCKTQREWIDKGLSVVPVSVNVSRVDIYNPKLCDNLKLLLEKYNLPIHLLSLEITETAYTENASQLIDVVYELKNMGFTVEMDDFGTGYSSLNMLNEVPVDSLKLDLRFLKPTKAYGRGANILNSVVSMAKWLNLPVVAEGIETKAQVDFLRSIGCNKGQGFFFAKPLSNHEFESLLDNSSGYTESEESNCLFVNFEELWNPNSNINIIFDQFVGGLCIFELRGDNFFIQRANDRFFEITNLDRDKIFSVTPYLKDYMIKEDRAQFFRKLKKAKESNGEVNIHCRFYNPQLSKVLYFSTIMKVIFNTSERTFFLGSVENITEQKEAEKKLINSEKQYISILEMTGEVAFYYNIIGNKIKYSNNYRAIFGKKPPAVVDIDVLSNSNLIHKDDQIQFCRVFEDIKNKNQLISKARVRILGSDLNFHWCIMQAKGMYDTDDMLIKIIGVISKEEVMKERIRIVE